MIHLEQPRMLLGALACIGLLCLLALLLRPGSQAMPYYSFWGEALRGSLANHLLPLLRRVRGLLTLALLLCCALLLGRPVVETPGELDWLVILDTSYSMSVRERDGRTRLEAAREAALRWLRELPAGDRVGLVAAGDPPHVVVAPSRERARLERALRSLQPEALPANVGAALELARRAGMEPVVFGDGAGGSGAPPAATGSGGVEGLRFGAGARRANRAIVAFRVQERWPEPALVELACASYGGAPPVRAVRLRGEDGQELEWSFPPGEQELREELPAWSGGLWRLALDEGDGCSWDDELSFALTRLERRGIALRAREGGGNPALSVALAIAASSFGVPLRSLEPGAAPRAEEILVQEGGALDPAELPRGGAILWGTALTGLLEPLAQGERAPADAAVLAVERTHPLCSGLPLDRLLVRRAALRPLAAAKPTALVAGPGGLPLIYEYETDGRRAFGTSFDLEQSDLPVSGVLVVLVHRCLMALMRPDAPLVSALRAGASRGPWSRSATDALSGGVLEGSFPAAPLGIAHALRAEGERELPSGQRVPVNLVDAGESRIAPGIPPGWSGREPERPRMQRALSGLLAAAALILFGLRGLVDLASGL